MHFTVSSGLVVYKYHTKNEKNTLYTITPPLPFNPCSLCMSKLVLTDPNAHTDRLHTYRRP